MNKPILLAALSGFVLIGAAYPAPPRLSYTIDLDGGAAATAPTTSWRPCRRDQRDDRCIQLYERGMRAAYAEWRSAHGAARLAAAHQRQPRRHAQLALALRCPQPAGVARPTAPPRPGEGSAVNGM